jgi:hypothetical protein
MTDIISSPPSDLKWPVLVGFAALAPTKPALKNSVLQAVADNFWHNVQRINWMILAPSLVGDLTIQIQRCYDTAELQVTGELAPSLVFTDHPKRNEIGTIAHDLPLSFSSTED